MPIKKSNGYKKRGYKKPAYRRIAQIRRRRAAKYNGGLVPAIRNTGVPDRMLLRLKYSDNIKLSPMGAAVWSDYPFRLNSIYDPDYLLGGHQPATYDQWGNFYKRYRVYRADVKLTIVSLSAVPFQACMTGINIESYPLANNDSVFEQPHSVTKIIASNTGNNKVVLKKSFDLPRIRGMSHEQYRTASVIASDWVSNPNDQMLLDIKCHSLDDLTQFSAMGLIEIVYHVEAFDKVSPLISNTQNNDTEATAKYTSQD